MKRLGPQSLLRRLSDKRGGRGGRGTGCKGQEGTGRVGVLTKLYPDMLYVTNIK